MVFTGKVVTVSMSIAWTVGIVILRIVIAIAVPPRRIIIVAIAAPARLALCPAILLGVKPSATAAPAPRARIIFSGAHVLVGPLTSACVPSATLHPGTVPQSRRGLRLRYLYAHGAPM